jgi:DNA-directed RNA polymerase specialized sigma24 family protein
MVLAGEAKNCKKEIAFRAQHEVSFSELSPHEIDQLYVIDEYPIESHHFSVLGYTVAVKDDLISEALAALPGQKREIILLSYFLDMTDQEIGEILNMVRRTVQYQRVRSLEQLKRLLEGKANE